MYDYESNPEAKGVEYQVTTVDPTDPETKGKVYQVHKVSEEVAATLNGKVYRARIIKDPTESTVIGKVYQVVFIDDPDDPSVKGKVYNAIVTGLGQVVVIGPAVSPLVLPDAIDGDIVSLKAFGGCEQVDPLDPTATPTPDNPIDIVCNNGVLKLLMQATGTGYQDGTPTPTNPIYPVFYQQGDMILRKVGDYADSYDATTHKITRRVGVKVLVGTEANFSSDPEGSGGYVRFIYSEPLKALGYAVSSNYFQTKNSTVTPNESSALISGNNNYANIILSFPANMLSGDLTTANGRRAAFNDWLAEQYAAGTPVTVYYSLETPTEENWTDSIVYTDGTVETIAIKDDQDTTVSTATCEDLLSIGTYTDQQEIIDGTVTRKVGVLVLDGTENWAFVDDVSKGYEYVLYIPLKARGQLSSISTHFKGVDLHRDLLANYDLGIFNYQARSKEVVIRYDDKTTVAQFKQWLADQYVAGTPVIIVYPLETPTTESVAGQPMQTAEGDNTAEITQAGMSGLELEVTYMAGVTLTVEEVEDAQLSPDVEVTIQ